MDPLDELLLAHQQEEYKVPASVLEIPMGDRPLFEQLRSNPKISDITDEIAFNKYLRILLQREFEKWSIDRRNEMVDKVMELVGQYDDNTLSKADLRDEVEIVLPSQNLTVNQARLLSKLLETSGKLAEQHKKITEGMEIKVNIADPGVITRMLVQIVYPCVPRDAWEAIRARARSFAPAAGSGVTLDLE